MKFLVLITIFVIFLFYGGVTGRSVEELEKIVAAQFVEVFDRIIRIEKEEIKGLKRKDLNNTEEIQFLKIQVEDLKNENAQETEIRIKNENKQAKEIQELEKKHEENKKEIEVLQQKVEDLQKLQAPETCSQLVKQGVGRGEDVYLDSDGVNHGKKQLLIVDIICIPLFLLNWILSDEFLSKLSKIIWEVRWNFTLIWLFCNHAQANEYRGSPTYTVFTTIDPTIAIFVLCMLKWKIFD